MAWATIGLWVLPAMENRMGMVASEQEKEELERKMSVKLAPVERDEGGKE